MLQSKSRLFISLPRIVNARPFSTSEYWGQLERKTVAGFVTSNGKGLLHPGLGMRRAAALLRKGNSLKGVRFKPSIIIKQSIVMKKQRDCGSSHKKYTKISTKRRQNLVEKVEKQRLPIAKVAKTLRINISTAKLILKKYKETGAFFNKRMCKLRPKVVKKTSAPTQEEEVPPLCEESEKQVETPLPAIDNQEDQGFIYLYGYCQPMPFYPFPPMFQIPL